MTPMPEPPKVEGDGGDTIALLEELSALRDPRSAEILIKYQMESGIMGRPVTDALVAMGPASVPALVARLDPPLHFSNYPNEFIISNCGRASIRHWAVSLNILLFRSLKRSQQATLYINTVRVGDLLNLDNSFMEVIKMQVRIFVFFCYLYLCFQFFWQ